MISVKRFTDTFADDSIPSDEHRQLLLSTLSKVINIETFTNDKIPSDKHRNLYGELYPEVINIETFTYFLYICI